MARPTRVITTSNGQRWLESAPDATGGYEYTCLEDGRVVDRSFRPLNKHEVECLSTSHALTDTKSIPAGLSEKVQQAILDWYSKQ